MDSRDISRAQAEQMRDRLRTYANYLHRVRRRMDRRGFPLSDELLLATDRAYDEARGLVMTLHYLSCKSGVGRPAKEAGGSTEDDHDDRKAGDRPRSVAE
jgi:hypothetical protein